MRYFPVLLLLTAVFHASPVHAVKFSANIVVDESAVTKSDTSNAGCTVAGQVREPTTGTCYTPSSIIRENRLRGEADRLTENIEASPLEETGPVGDPELAVKTEAEELAGDKGKTVEQTVKGRVSGTIGIGLGLKLEVHKLSSPQLSVGPVTVAPAKTRRAAEDRVEVARLAQSENPAAAREFALKALERTPDDAALMSFVKLTAPVKAAVEGKTVKSRIAELMAGMRQDEGSGEGGVALASPISFGAMGAGASRGPAVPPAGLGLTIPDAHGAAALRDASGKIAIKDYAGAETALTRRIEEAPTDAGAFRLRAMTRRALTRFEDSAEDARQAVTLNPRDSRSLHLLSRDLTDLGRPQEALVEADRSLVIDNRDAHAYIARSVALNALGRGEEALADLAKAASLDSQFDALYNDAVALKGGVAPKRPRSWSVWLGAIGTALLFFSFALFRKRGDSSARLALRQDDHDALAAVAPRVDAVPKGFRVVRTLGQGGMGVVYEAVDLGLQRTVALKKMRSEISDNPRERGRFLKEARTVAGLKHPNIVEIHAIHEDAEGLFLVFERVPGETLHERLGRGPMNPAEACAFFKQVASALDYAHGEGVVHQDLKPANVMVHAGLAKVMDFGIARRVAETLSTMSKVEVAGTPAYMAPEQEQGVVTPSADVYALGACAYEALTGALPFPTGGIMLKAQKMYRKPSEASPGLRAGVDAAIGRALEPRPEDRWPSASSFVDALSRALS